MASASGRFADRIFVQATFNGLARFRIARTAVIRLELEAVENRRIVAGGNHHAADGAQIFDGERNRRRRRRFGRKDDLKMISGENFGRELCKSVGEKPAVIADDDFSLLQRLSDFRLSDFRFQKSAAACATRATLANVKSSAMTARQPSVPNLICATRRVWHSGLYMPSIAVAIQKNPKVGVKRRLDNLRKRSQFDGLNGGL